MTAYRTANITISHARLSNHQFKLELDDNNPMSLCYAIASFWMYNSPRKEMTERFGCKFDYEFPNFSLNGIPGTDAKGWFQIFSEIIGEENTKKFIETVKENYPTGKTEYQTKVFAVNVPINFPRSTLEKPIDFVRETWYERSFKVRDILRVMELPHSTRYICHAVSMLIMNGDAPLENLFQWYNEQDTQWAIYRQPYYNCTDMFTSVADELSAQVIAQTKHEVNESIFSFIPNADDYGYNPESPEFWLVDNEYYDFVNRHAVLTNMLNKDPEAEIRVKLNVPLDFALAMAQLQGY